MARKNISQDVLIYRMKIMLNYTKPTIWRRVEVPSHVTLSSLHYIIQKVMGWENDHLWEFIAGKTIYSGESYDDDFFGIEKGDANTARLCDVLKQEKSKIRYLYDMGDSWEHTVVLEKIYPPAAEAVYPRCMAGKMACPPEDCGGIPGFYNMLECISDPQNSQYEFYKEWLGDEYDPEHFDLEEINKFLKKLK